jgi:hypothetical protein
MFKSTGLITEYLCRVGGPASLSSDAEGNHFNALERRMPTF